MGAAKRTKGLVIRKEEAKALVAIAESFMEETGRILARCSSRIEPSEWEATGKCFAELWSTVGDDILYPVGDA